MPKVAGKLSFSMREGIEVFKKTPLYSIFEAKSLDFGGINKISKECFRLL